jgi:hypothetical protein
MTSLEESFENILRSRLPGTKIMVRPVGELWDASQWPDTGHRYCRYTDIYRKTSGLKGFADYLASVVCEDDTFISLGLVLYPQDALDEQCIRYSMWYSSIQIEED